MLPTPQQLVIIRGLSRGLKPKQIATEMNLSYHTIRSQVHYAMTRTHTHNQAHLVATGFREGWLS